MKKFIPGRLPLKESRFDRFMALLDGLLNCSSTASLFNDNGTAEQQDGRPDNSRFLAWPPTCKVTTAKEQKRSQRQQLQWHVIHDTNIRAYWSSYSLSGEFKERSHLSIGPSNAGHNLRNAN
jgi:hypothetical protein